MLGFSDPSSLLPGLSVDLEGRALFELFVETLAPPTESPATADSILTLVVEDRVRNPRLEKSLPSLFAASTVSNEVFVALVTPRFSIVAELEVSVSGSVFAVLALVEREGSRRDTTSNGVITGGDLEGRRGGKSLNFTLVDTALGALLSEAGTV